MTISDLSAVMAIAARVHPDFFEGKTVFAERLRLFPAGARIFETSGRVAGYLFSHPWRSLDIPALNCLLGALPEEAATYYIHDLALWPSARGTGAAGSVIADLLESASRQGLRSASLVAVNGSQGFWAKYGFVVDPCPELSSKLVTYEPSAAFMVKPLQ